MIKAVINVEAPREHVFSILTDYAKYPKWLPGCEQSDVLNSSGNAVDTEILVNAMKRMKLGLRFEAQPSQLLTFKMLSCKDMKAYQGSYRLMDAADGKGTVVIAEIEIDPGAMVPKFMVDRIAKKSIEDTGTALRQYVKTVPMEAAAKPPAAPAKPAEARKVRARRILMIVQTGQGYTAYIGSQAFQMTRQRAGG